MINLGTEKHREKYFDGIDNLDYPGCFAMTELHHGELLLAYNRLEIRLLIKFLCTLNTINAQRYLNIIMTFDYL